MARPSMVLSPGSSPVFSMSRNRLRVGFYVGLSFGLFLGDVARFLGLVGYCLGVCVGWGVVGWRCLARSQVLQRVFTGFTSFIHRSSGVLLDLYFLTSTCKYVTIFSTAQCVGGVQPFVIRDLYLIVNFTIVFIMSFFRCSQCVGC